MKLISVFATILFVTLSIVNCKGQSNMSDFEVYYFPYNFDDKQNKLIQAQGYVPISLITKSMIDPDGDNVVDRKPVSSYLKKEFPNVNANGICVIDWETQNFKHLQKFALGTKEFEFAQDQFINLIRLIKKERPNVRVGVYGIPFRGFYKSQRAINIGNKFDELLKECDFLAPSYYIMYAISEIGPKRNLNYLSENLDIALTYAKRLNLPVIPFFWHKINPYNKRFGWKEMEFEDFLTLSQHMRTYNKGGHSISGMIWWNQLKASERGRAERLNDNTKMIHFMKRFKQAFF